MASFVLEKHKELPNRRSAHTTQAANKIHIGAFVDEFETISSASPCGSGSGPVSMTLKNILKDTLVTN